MEGRGEDGGVSVFVMLVNHLPVLRRVARKDLSLMYVRVIVMYLMTVVLADV